MTDLELLRDGTVVRVVREQRAGRWHVTIDSDEITVDSLAVDSRQISLGLADGRHVRVSYARSGGRLLVSLGGRTLELLHRAGDPADADEHASAFTAEVTAPMPGKVLEVLVTAGDEVTHDAPLVRLEAMKMEQTIRAGAPGRVREVCTKIGAMVRPGAVLLLLDPPAD